MPTGDGEDIGPSGNPFETLEPEIKIASTGELFFQDSKKEKTDATIMSQQPIKGKLITGSRKAPKKGSMAGFGSGVQSSSVVHKHPMG